VIFGGLIIMHHTVYNYSGRTDGLVKGGAKRVSLGKSKKTKIKEWISEDCGLTLNAIKQKFLNQLNIDVSKSSIDRAICSFNYTMKRVHLIPERRNCPEIILKRLNYANTFVEILASTDDSKIFFIDEVGFNISMRARRGRSQVGTRAVQIVPGLRTRNVLVCACISKNGVLNHKIETRAFNINLFLSYMETVCEKLENLNIKNAVFIMDNVRFHRSDSICNFILNKGHQVLYLPPYSPFLNPIENMFAKWKQIIRSERFNNELQSVS